MRVVLHAHSTWSYDGSWRLEDLARLYGRLGVDVVMMTEHDTGFDPDRFAAYRVACRDASTARCTLIPGIEYSSENNDIHILTWGLEVFLAEHRPTSETLERVSQARGAAIFAHPIRRRAFAQFDAAWVPHLCGIELWNRKSDGVVWGQEAHALIRETGLRATVGQDFHKLRHLWPLSMQVPRPEGDLEEGLVRALREGLMVPQAFRCPLFKPDGQIIRQPHSTFETLRRRARDLLRGNKRKT